MRGRRVVKVFALALAALVAVVAAALIALALRPELLTGPVQRKVLPRLSDRLGRKVELGRMQAAVWPTPRVTLEQVRVHGAPGEPDLISARAGVVEVRVWKLLRSLGKQVEVKSIQLQDPQVAVVHRPDGTWSYAEAAQRWQRTAPAPTDTEVLISNLSVVNGVVSLEDRTQGSPTSGRITALTHLDFDGEDLGLGQTARLRAKAALGSPAQNLALELSIDLPAQLEQGRWPVLRGELKADSISLHVVGPFLPARLQQVVTGGSLRARIHIVTQADGALALTGRAGLEPLHLRGGDAQGQLELVAHVPAGHPERAAGEIRRLELSAPGTHLEGTGSFRAQPRQVNFAIRGERLDVGWLLGTVPEKPPTQRAPTEPMLSAQARAQLAQTQVRGTLELGELVNGKLRVTQLRGKATLRDGVLELEEAQGELYGGRVALGGTRVDLAQPLPRWALRAQVQKVDLGQGMAELAGERPAEGELAANVNLEGEGSAWAQIRPLLTGGGKMELAQGTLGALNLDAALADHLRAAVPRLAPQMDRVGQPVRWKDLSFSFHVREGRLVLEDPVRLPTRLGAATLGGAVGLDRSLHLEGAFELPPEVLGRLTRGALSPSKPVSVPLRLRGTLARPQVELGDPAALGRQLVASDTRVRGVQNQVQRRAREAQEQARRRIRGLLRP